MTIYVVVSNDDNVCLGSCDLHEVALEQCEGNNARVVELHDKTHDDIHCKKWIDGELVDHVEAMQYHAVEETRALRDQILSEVVDPLVTNVARFNELTEADQQAWLQYRKDLLNVPQQVGFPFNVEWPVAPNDQRAITE